MCTCAIWHAYETSIRCVPNVIPIKYSTDQITTLQTYHTSANNLKTLASSIMALMATKLEDICIWSFPMDKGLCYNYDHPERSYAVSVRDEYLRNGTSIT